MTRHVLFGFHAVGVRLRVAPQSVVELHVDGARRDARMRQFVERAAAAGTRIVESSDERLQALAATPRHQGVVARVEPLRASTSLDDTLDAVAGPPLVLVLDGVTDPHNLGACLRVADGAGANAVIAPKDHAVGINATVAKVASGAAETVPYFMVTNLARTLNELKEREIRIVGTDEHAARTIYEIDLRPPAALVLRRRRSRAAPAHREDLRRAGAAADARRGREPQRLGRGRGLPVRGGAAARADDRCR